MSSTPQPVALPPILFIGGGNMSNAIISGLISSSTFQQNQIYIVDPVQKQLDNLNKLYPQLNTSTSVSQSLLNKVGFIVLGVKPGLVPVVLKSIAAFLNVQKHIVVSICAGVPTQTINNLINQHTPSATPSSVPIPVIRVMPNTPALVQAGASGICKGIHATDHHISLVNRVMSAVGLVVVVNETEMDAVCGVSGSGPAYVLTFIEALTTGGVAAGLSYPISYQLALDTVYGTAKMLKDTKQHPAILREQICSPGGTTITGLRALHEKNFNAAIISCVCESANRGAYLAAKL